MFKLLFAMAMGFVLRRTKVVSAEANRGFSALVVNLTSPALALYAVLNQSEVNAEAFKLVGFGAALYVLMPLLAFGVMLLLNPAKDIRGVYQMLLVFGNVNFMGFPVAQAVYGDQAIFYINILHIPFTLMIFTYGVRLLRSGTAQGGMRLKLRDVLSPGFIAAVLSLVFYFLRIRFPALITNALGFVGSMTTPLSMLVIGGMIAGFGWRELWAEKRLYLLAIIKLGALPLLGFAAASLVFRDPVMVGAVTLSLAMPSGTLVPMVASQYGSQRQTDVAALGVFITTVLSMVSIPLVILALT